MSVAPSPQLTADELLRLQTFAPLVESAVSVQRGSEWVTLKLTEAKTHGKHGGDVGEKFSLLFSAGPEKPLQQGLHLFEHLKLGTFELFITPVMCPHQDLRWYEAVINRETGL